MKGKSRKKIKFLLSIFICFLIAGTGLSAYAIATGRMPQILNAVASVFVPSAAGASSKAQIADLQIASSSPSTVSDSNVDPSEINPTDSINHSNKN